MAKKIRNKLSLLTSVLMILLPSLTLANAQSKLDSSAQKIEIQNEKKRTSSNLKKQFNKQQTYSLVELFTNPNFSLRVLNGLVASGVKVDQNYGINAPVHLADLEQIKSLDLSNLGLNNIDLLTNPSFKWTNLHTLNVSENDFANINLDFNVNQFPQLYSFNANNAGLRAFPNFQSYVGAKNQLRVLNFADNFISSLPTYISNFSLGSLNLANNLLSQSINPLAVALNKISNLPTIKLQNYDDQLSIDGLFDGTLDKLPYLNLANNNLAILPKINFLNTTQLAPSSRLDLAPNAVSHYYFTLSGLMELLGETSLSPSKLAKNKLLTSFSFVQNNQAIPVSSLNVDSPIDLSKPFSLQLHNKLFAVAIHVNAKFDNQLQTATSVSDQNFKKLQTVANLLPSQLNVNYWQSSGAFWQSNNFLVQTFFANLSSKQLTLDPSDDSGVLSWSAGLVLNPLTKQATTQKFSGYVKGLRQLVLETKDDQQKFRAINLNNSVNHVINTTVPNLIKKIADRFGMSALSTSIIASCFQTNWPTITNAPTQFTKLSANNVKIVNVDETNGKMYFQFHLTSNFNPWLKKLASTTFVWSKFNKSNYRVLGKSFNHKILSSRFNLANVAADQVDLFKQVVRAKPSEISATQLLNLNVFQSNRSDWMKVNGGNVNQYFSLSADDKTNVLHLSVQLPGNKKNNLAPLNAQISLDFNAQKTGIKEATSAVKGVKNVPKFVRQASTTELNVAATPDVLVANQVLQKAAELKRLTSYLPQISALQTNPNSHLFASNIKVNTTKRRDVFVFPTNPFELRVSNNSTITGQTSDEGASVIIKFDFWNDDQIKNLFSYLANHDDQDWKQNIQRALQEYLTSQAISKVKQITFGNASDVTWNILNAPDSTDIEGGVLPGEFWNFSSSQLEWQKPGTLIQALTYFTVKNKSLLLKNENNPARHNVTDLTGLNEVELKPLTDAISWVYGTDLVNNGFKFNYTSLQYDDVNGNLIVGYQLESTGALFSGLNQVKTTEQFFKVGGFLNLETSLNEILAIWSLKQGQSIVASEFSKEKLEKTGSDSVVIRNLILPSGLNFPFAIKVEVENVIIYDPTRPNQNNQLNSGFNNLLAGQVLVSYKLKTQDSNKKDFVSNLKTTIIRNFLPIQTALNQASVKFDQKTDQKIDNVLASEIKNDRDFEKHFSSTFLNWQMDVSGAEPIVKYNNFVFDNTTGSLVVTYYLEKSFSSTGDSPFNYKVSSELKKVTINGFATIEKLFNTQDPEFVNQTGVILGKVYASSLTTNNWQAYLQVTNLHSSFVLNNLQVLSSNDVDGVLNISYQMIQENSGSLSKVFTKKISGFLTFKADADVASATWTSLPNAKSTYVFDLPITDAQKYLSLPTITGLTSSDYIVEIVKITPASPTELVKSDQIKIDYRFVLNPLGERVFGIIKSVIVDGFLTLQADLNNTTAYWVATSKQNTVNASSVKSPTASDTNFSQYVNTTGFLVGNINNRFKAKIVGIEAQDNLGSLLIKYKVVYNDVSNEIMLESAEKSYTLTGFLNDQISVDQTDLTSKHVTFNKKTDSTSNVLASAITVANINDYVKITNSNANTSYQIIQLTPNDATGVLLIKYQLQKGAAFVVKEAQVNGFVNNATAIKTKLDKAVSTITGTAVNNFENFYASNFTNLGLFYDTNQTTYGSVVNFSIPADANAVLVLSGEPTADDNAGTLTFQVVLVSKTVFETNATLVQSNVHSVVVGGFQTFEKALNKANAIFVAKTDLATQKQYPSKITNASLASAPLTTYATSYVVGFSKADSTKTVTVEVIGVDDLNDLNGSLTVKYKLKINEGSKSVESTEKTAKLTGLFTYQRDLEQTQVSFSIKDGKSTSSISIINATNWNTYFNSSISGNQNPSVKVVVDNVSPNLTNGSLSLVYHLEIPGTTAGALALANSFVRTTTVSGFSDLQSRADALNLTFKLKPQFTNKVFVNQINELNWNAYLNFSPNADEHTEEKNAVPIDLKVVNYDLLAGSATLSYKVLLNGLVSETEKTFNLTGLKKMDANYLNNNFSVEWGVNQTGLQVLPSTLTKSNISTNLSDPIFNTLNFANVSVTIEQVDEQNDVNGTAQITYKLTATNGKTGSSIMSVVSANKTTTVSGFWSYEKIVNDASATWTLKTTSSATGGKLASSITVPSSPTDTSWTSVFSNPTYSVIPTANKDNLSFAIKGLNPDDSIGALVIRYTLTLTVDKQTQTSAEKSFTVYGFQSNVNASVVDNASVNFTSKGNLKSILASNLTLESFNDFFYISKQSNVNVNVDNLFANDTKGQLVVAYTITSGVQRTGRIATISGFLTLQTAEQIHLNALLNQNLTNKVGNQIFASSLDQASTDDRGTEAIFNALQLPVLNNAKFVVDSAVGDDANGTLTLTYHYVLSTNESWKSANKTIVIRGFLTYLTALNLVKSQLILKPEATSTIYASSVTDLDTFKRVFDLQVLNKPNSSATPAFNPEVVSMKLQSSDDLTGAISVSYTLGFKAGALIYKSSIVNSFNLSSGFLTFSQGLANASATWTLKRGNNAVLPSNVTLSTISSYFNAPSFTGQGSFQLTPEFLMFQPNDEEGTIKFVYRLRAVVNGLNIYSAPQIGTVDGFNKESEFLDTYLPTVTLRPSAQNILPSQINDQNWNNFLSVYTGDSGISLVDITPSNVNVLEGTLNLNFKVQKNSKKSNKTKSLFLSGFGKLSDQLSGLKAVWTPKLVKTFLPATLSALTIQSDWLSSPQFSARIMGATSQTANIQKIVTNPLVGTIDITYTVSAIFPSNSATSQPIISQPQTTTIGGFLSYQQVVDQISVNWTIKDAEAAKKVLVTSLTPQSVVTNLSDAEYNSSFIGSIVKTTDLSSEVVQVQPFLDTGGIVLTYVVKLSKDGFTATSKLQTTNLYGFQSTSVDEAADLKNLEVNFSRKSGALQISPSLVILTGVDANFVDQIEYNPYPGNSVSLSIEQLYGDDQAKTLHIVYRLHKGITTVRRVSTIIGFPEIDQGHKVALNEQLKSLTIVPAVRISDNFASTFVPEGSGDELTPTYTDDQLSILNNFLNFGGIHNAKVVIEKVSADDTKGELSVQVKLASLTNSSYISDSKTITINNFLTYQQNVDHATANWTWKGDTSQVKYPSSLAKETIDTSFKTAFENFVNQNSAISDLKAVVLSLENANDVIGSVIVKYNVQYTVKGVTYTSKTPKMFVLTGLLTYNQDLNQTSATFTLPSSINKSNVFASTITKTSLTAVLLGNNNSNAKVEIINLLADDQVGELGIIYLIQLNVREKNYTSVEKVATLKNFQTSSSVVNDKVITFRPKLSAQLVLPSEITTTNWSNYFDASDHNFLVNLISISDTNDETGSLKIKYTLSTLTGIVSTSSKEATIANSASQKFFLTNQTLVQSAMVNWSFKPNMTRTVLASSLTATNWNTYLDAIIINNEYLSQKLTVDVSNITAVDYLGQAVLTYKLLLNGTAIPSAAAAITKTFTLRGFLTTQEKLNDAFATFSSVLTTGATPSSKISNVFASSIKINLTAEHPEAFVNYVMSAITSTASESTDKIKVKLNSIVGNDELGVLTINYQLVETSDYPSGSTSEILSDFKTFQLGGFALLSAHIGTSLTNVEVNFQAKNEVIKNNNLQASDVHYFGSEPNFEKYITATPAYTSVDTEGLKPILIPDFVKKITYQVRSTYADDVNGVLFVYYTVNYMSYTSETKISTVRSFLAPSKDANRKKLNDEVKNLQFVVVDKNQRAQSALEGEKTINLYQLSDADITANEEDKKKLVFTKIPTSANNLTIDETKSKYNYNVNYIFRDFNALSNPHVTGTGILINFKNWTQNDIKNLWSFIAWNSRDPIARQYLGKINTITSNKVTTSVVGWRDSEINRLNVIWYGQENQLLWRVGGVVSTALPVIDGRGSTYRNIDILSIMKGTPGNGAVINGRYSGSEGEFVYGPYSDGLKWNIFKNLSLSETRSFNPDTNGTDYEQNIDNPAVIKSIDFASSLFARSINVTNLPPNTKLEIFNNSWDSSDADGTITFYGKLVSTLPHYESSWIPDSVESQYVKLTVPGFSSYKSQLNDVRVDFKTKEGVNSVYTTESNAKNYVSEPTIGKFTETKYDKQAVSSLSVKILNFEPTAIQSQAKITYTLSALINSQTYVSDKRYAYVNGFLTTPQDVNNTIFTWKVNELGKRVAANEVSLSNFSDYTTAEASNRIDSSINYRISGLKSDLNSGRITIQYVTYKDSYTYPGEKIAIVSGFRSSQTAVDEADVTFSLRSDLKPIPLPSVVTSTNYLSYLSVSGLDAAYRVTNFTVKSFDLKAGTLTINFFVFDPISNLRSSFEKQQVISGFTKFDDPQSFNFVHFAVKDNKQFASVITSENWNTYINHSTLPLGVSIVDVNVDDLNPFAGTLVLKYKFQLATTDSSSAINKSVEFNQKISGFAPLIVSLTMSDSTISAPNTSDSNQRVLLPNSPFAQIALKNIEKPSDLWLTGYPLFNDETIKQYGLTKSNINDSVTLTKDLNKNSLTINVNLKANTSKNLLAVNDIMQTFSGWFDFTSNFMKTNAGVAKVAALSLDKFERLRKGQQDYLSGKQNSVEAKEFVDFINNLTFGVYPNEPILNNPITRSISTTIRSVDAAGTSKFIFDYNKIHFTNDFQIVFDPGSVKSNVSYKLGTRTNNEISLETPLVFRTIFVLSNEVVPNRLAIEVGVPVGIISSVIAIALISIFVARKMQLQSGSLSSRLSKKKRRV